MQFNKQFLFSGVGLASLSLAALVLIGLIYTLPTSIRFDLTENNLFTVTEGSKRIIDGLEKTIKLQLFFTKETTKDSPFMRNHAKLATELLNEMVLLSDGKLELEVVDPVPFSEEEDKAAEYGLTAVPSGVDKLYLGLVGIGEDNKREAIPFLHPSKENYLEYDISQMIYKLGTAKKPVIGFVSDLQINGGFDMMKGTQTPAWFAVEQLRKLYTVKNLNKDFDKVDEEVNLLMVIHTKNLSDKVLYAIDQYVLNGGKAVFFVDPNSEMEPRNHMMRQQQAPENTYPLEALFVKWGVTIPQDKVVGDAAHALNIGAGPGRQPVRHLALMGLGKSNIKEDVTTNQLESLNFMTAGYIEHDKKSGTQFTPLIRTSTQAGTFDSALFRFMMDPSALYQSFSATGENYVLAAKVSGKVSTAFPDGKPKEEVEEGSETESEDETKSGDDSKPEEVEEKPHVHLAESAKDINVMIISDSDVLSDRLWVNVQQFFGQKIANAFADNGNFLTNIVDQFSGSEDLISIRGRENYSRPFYVVEELKRQAEDRFREKEQELQNQLQDTEDKLRELQTPKEGEETINLSEEQQKTVQEFLAKKLQIRKDLRNVKHQLNKDIKGLGTTIKFINIMTVPLVLIFCVLFYLFFMRRRQYD